MNSREGPLYCERKPEVQQKKRVKKQYKSTRASWFDLAVDHKNDRRGTAFLNRQITNVLKKFCWEMIQPCNIIKT